MSRKRGSTHAYRRGNRNKPEECEFVYYDPGCYYAPQVSALNSSSSGAYLQQDYTLLQWQPMASNEATYVVDNGGRVYYTSDFEHLLQLPSVSGRPSASIINYHHDPTACQCAGPACLMAMLGAASITMEGNSEENEDDDAMVRKRERLDSDMEFGDGQERFNDDVADGAKKVPGQGLKNPVYRSKHGYLVEEPPSESDDPCG